MSEQPAASQVPSWDLADRMRKSLRHAGMSVQEMADYLDVDRSTVSTWINGRIDPSGSTAKLWAMRTGVPYTWLCHGSTKPCDLVPRGVSAGQGGIIRRQNNTRYSQAWTAA